MENRNIFVLETEREQVKRRLEAQISTIRSTLDYLENKLKNNQELYISDGLQGNGGNIDIYLAQLIAYNRGIEILERQINPDR